MARKHYRVAKNRITNLSEHDLLTGLYNRRGMQQKIDYMIENVKFRSKWLVIEVDMDGLKILNDNYGHSHGDLGLTMIASALKAATRDDEICVRSGGDEFYIIGLGRYSLKDVQDKIEVIRQTLKKENEKNNPEIPVSCSIGYCLENFSVNKGKIEKVLETADLNMYLDKRSKKGLAKAR